jgi:dTDP-4-amino-4,6-dideoxy-D-galactose acyltransferase
MALQDVCRYLSWDSDFFGRRIGTVAAKRLTPEDVPRIESWCEANRIDCLYFLADIGDQPSIRSALELGFAIVDVRVTLENSRLHAESLDVSDRIRLAESRDLAALKRIAGISHHGSRFYADGHLPVERCNQLYETWIEKSCDGSLADCVLVADQDDEAVGYVSANMRERTSGEIGLAAVASEAQGKGVGTQLVRASLRWFASKGAQRVSVVTQGANISAQRLYQGCGFFTRKMELWFHRWYRAEDRAVK